MGKRRLDIKSVRGKFGGAAHRGNRPGRANGATADEQPFPTYEQGAERDGLDHLLGIPFLVESGIRGRLDPKRYRALLEAISDRVRAVKVRYKRQPRGIELKLDWLQIQTVLDALALAPEAIQFRRRRLAQLDRLSLTKGNDPSELLRDWNGLRRGDPNPLYPSRRACGLPRLAPSCKRHDTEVRTCRDCYVFEPIVGPLTRHEAFIAVHTVRFAGRSKQACEKALRRADAKGVPAQAED